MAKRILLDIQDPFEKLEKIQELQKNKQYKGLWLI